MQELNFANIRNHDGSRDNGFEELVCQLAHISPPENADYFVRKDGAGGDAGVECYWKLKDGSEHAWQAKYFLGALEATQWKQISESVETALKKHPDLTKYYVCLPRDWNDSRKIGSGGRVVNSAWDKWQDHVAKWGEIADDLGMQVEFNYWCKHELSLLLQRNEPKYEGRAHYWFNSPILTTEIFQRLSERSRSSLGERYTPECHLELPLAEVFDALARTDAWWDKLKTRIKNWQKTAKDAEAAMISVGKSTTKIDVKSVKAEVDDLYKHLINAVLKRTFLFQIEKFKQPLTALMPKLKIISDELLKITPHEKEKEQHRHQRSQFYKFESETEQIFRFLENSTFRAAIQRCLLLEGEAGIGKSHLLCDVAINRLNEGLPTLFLLGQHYQGGNPFLTLKDVMDLNAISHQVFLGALDAAGEASGSNTLIIIDAINEGIHRDDWIHHISAFTSEILCFPNLSVVFSCRSTFVEYLVPKELIDKTLDKIIHKGFSGFEHRAATKYLSGQGIVKPSTPITAPEFTNPLFLKTCCKALKDSGETSFPKGLHGITRLFSFYLDSMEKVVALKKRYRPGDDIVIDTLEVFTENLYPDYLFGIPLKDARKLINDCDQNPQYGDPLFDVLLHEGIFSEDIEIDNDSNQKFVIRFTYERFSDLLIAQRIAKDIRKENLDSIFKPDGLLSALFKDHSYYSKAGILSSLSIVIAEQWGRELVDIIPEDAVNDSWFFDQIFTETLLWRSGDSFTERTLELLNQVSGNDFKSQTIDVLMALATEPSHPWNAELLHKNLVRMSMPERDAFWSTHIAISDYDEENYEEESVLRSLIDWAHSGDIDLVEPERIRLCAIVLMWATSTSNRKIRDQATKSIVRILSYYPTELENILGKFHDVNDLYVRERLYAVAFGVVSNINDEQIIKSTADIVFKTVFASGQPYPHILLRDYATSILELVYVSGLIDSEIDPGQFRPPFKSEWPLEDPTQEELDELTGDKYSSSIRSSIMGFPGDFGNYSMGCVHNWSPTSIEKKEPQTAYDLQCEFAEILPPGLKERFLKQLDIQKEIDKKPFGSIENIEFEIVDKKSEKEKKPTEYDLLKAEIEAILTTEQKEQFRWVMGLGRSNSIGAFSRKKAQRWVCKRAIELGWEKELFEEFERYHTSSVGRSPAQIERIGKKYQWIAFHEFLAHLADNCCYIDPGYSDVDYSKYYGPWQIHERNIDPTCWLRKTGEDGWYNSEKQYWWQPFVFSCFGKSTEEKQEWLWDENLIPPFERLLQVQNPSTNESWYVLRSFANWNKKSQIEDDENPNQDAWSWYRINSCILHKDQVEILEKALQGKNLCDPHILQPYSTGHQGFLKEYPWHPVYKDMKQWDDEIGFGIEFKIEHLVPTATYEWESGSTDHSLENSISIYLPAKEIIQSLKLFHDEKVYFGQWVNSNQETIFFDPSTQFDGPSSALIESSIINSWLEKNNLQLIWLIGGGKQLYKSMSTKFYGRLTYSGIYKLSNMKLIGNTWCIKESPKT